MSGFFGGFAQGFDWGYKTTGKALAKRDIEKLQAEDVAGGFDPEQHASQFGLTADGQQAKMLAEQEQDFNPTHYEYAGKRFDTEPTAFDRSYAYNDRLGDIYNRYGMFDRGAAAKGQAMTAQIQGLDHGFKQAGETRAQAKHVSDMTTADVNRGLATEQNTRAQAQHDVDMQSSKLGLQQKRREVARVNDVEDINKAFYAALSGDLQAVDYLAQQGAPVYNGDDVVDDANQIVDVNGAPHIQPARKGAKPISVQQVMQGVPNANRRDALAIMHQYALAARTGNHDNLTKLQAARAKAAASGGKDQLSELNKRANYLNTQLKDLSTEIMNTVDEDARAKLITERDWVYQQMNDTNARLNTAFGLSTARNPNGRVPKQFQGGAQEPPVAVNEPPKQGLSRRDQRNAQAQRRTEREQVAGTSERIIAAIKEARASGDTAAAQNLFATNEGLLRQATDDAMVTNYFAAAKNAAGLTRRGH